MQTIALRLSDLVLNREFCHLDMEDYFLFTSFFFFCGVCLFPNSRRLYHFVLKSQSSKV